ncbi:phage tail length tape measure family protein [Mesorhizobium sp. RP14(2022)]|uniref:Phage tail length tape measure family protein n=1 Tax=Mesorhizobium liriopis TaxID=2953882 RepID=A0ABT1C7M7_9HYPH|nr:phage tail length tape measure family protein [Mesorhizobium liriopis]MCO6050835.1 phage tail length tape measure family protein [Mesorhizobium liriopis]
MADVATLGLAVDSSQVERGTGALQDLANASKRAEAATNGVSAAARNASAIAASAAKAKYAEASAHLASVKAAENASRADIQAATAAKRLAGAAYEAANAEKARQSALFAAATAAEKDTQAALRHAAALEKEAAAAQASAAKMAAANTNHPGAGGVSGSKANTANIAAQFQDVAVTAAMGMNAMQIGLQQGTQLAGVLMTMERPIQGLGEAFLALLSPVSIATIAFTALLALGLQMVEWPKAASAAVNFLADSLEAIAPYAAVAAAGLALIYAPTILAGLASVTTGLIGITLQATRMAVTFAASWVAALGPIGLVVAAVTAAGIAIVAFGDEISEILGFDVVEAARTGANAVIGTFVGAYRAAELIWGKFPDYMADIGALAAYNMGAALREMLRQVLIDVNNAMTQISRAMGFEQSPQIPVNKVIPEHRKDANGKLVQLYPKPQVSAGGQGAYDQVAKVFRDAQSEDWVGKVGEGAEWASGKLKDLAGWLSETDEKKKKKGRTRHGKTDAEKYSDIVEGAERTIASLKAEQAAVGLTAEAAAKLRYETDLLNQAQQKGITLTAAQKAELSGLAGEMASIEAATKKAQDALDFARDVTGGFFSDFKQGIEDGKGIWQSFADAALNALDKIVDKLLNDVMDAMFQTATPGGQSVGGGLLSWITGAFGGRGTNAGSTALGGIPWAQDTFRANGGPVSAGRAYIVGEKRPEVFVPNRSGTILPRVPSANNNQPAAGNQNGPSFTFNIDAKGSTLSRGEFEDIARQQAVAAVQANNEYQENRYQNGAAR